MMSITTREFILFILLMGVIAFNINRSNPTSYEKVERLNARERFEVVHWRTQACESENKICTDYYNQNLKQMKKYYPKLAEELDYDNRLKGNK